MRWIKWSVGLAVALAAAAITAGSIVPASTQAEGGDSEIVLCKHAALLLCGANEIWPEGKTVTGTSTALTILGTLSVKCANVEMEGTITPAMAERLTWNLVSAEITECGGCTITIEELLNPEVSVDSSDNYFMLVQVKVKTNCLGVKCVATGHSLLPLTNPTRPGHPWC